MRLPNYRYADAQASGWTAVDHGTCTMINRQVEPSGDAVVRRQMDRTSEGKALSHESPGLEAGLFDLCLLDAKAPKSNEALPQQ